MKGRPHFGPELFEFLSDLRRNNRREWFLANKSRYDADVRDPMLRFIGDFAVPLRTISRHFVADARPSGGSLFRLHRDTRFSRDKSPYKTNVAAHFRHETARDAHAPAFYFHLEPDQVFLAAGLWHPDADALAQVRQAIVARPAHWKRALSGKDFRARCSLSGDGLARAPKGYDPAHPLIEDIKRKDFVAVTRFTENQACARDFLDRCAEAYRAQSPLVAFVTRALGLPW
jgi:uncharacterized protein (TIGR02453 family)